MSSASTEKVLFAEDIAAENMSNEQLEDLESIILISSTTRYMIKEIIGEGTFGRVASAVDLNTSQEVVVKVLLEKAGADQEIAMLDVVRDLDPAHLIDFKEKFEFNGERFLVFEHLDMDLYKLLKQQNRPLTLNEIRPIAHQLLAALRSLRRVSVVHSDIKPDNIMLVNHQNEPFRVKLIDFGVSFIAGNIKPGEQFQPEGYRAPEVTLGLPITEAIDMWGLGCILLFLYLGNDAFAPCEYQTIKALVDLLGQPDDHLLSRGLYTHFFFIKDMHWRDPGWSLMILNEYQCNLIMEPLQMPQFRCLHDLITLYPVTHGSTELSDRRAFVSLIKSLIEVDPSKRPTPERALSHPFLTMLHLMEDSGSEYTIDCLQKMEVVGPENYMGNEPFYNLGRNTRNKLPEDLRGIVLYSSTTRYMLLEIIGVGTFSQVASAVDLNTSEEVVVKVLEDLADIDRETTMLKAVRGLDPAHLVDLRENFEYNGERFLVFERLDMDLYKLLKQQNGPLTLNQIRPITHQLLVALKSVRRAGVVHSDITPDNIMLVNHQNEPFRVKLIDFGVSFMRRDIKVTKILQPLGYCAPEVTLGLPITEAIDMWGLGCVLLYLYLGNDVFAPCEYQTIKTVVDMLGQPDDHLLSGGVHTHLYFNRNQQQYKLEWSLKTPSEYQGTTGIEPLLKPPQVRCLRDLISLYPVTRGSTELSDRRAFVSLIEGLMEVDPSKRITPEGALSHPFLTMFHLMKDSDNIYTRDCLQKMEVLELDNSLCEEFFHDKYAEKTRNKLPEDLHGIVLSSSTTSYMVKEVIGKGDFGQVASAVDLNTSREVVVKVLEEDADVDREIAMLEAVRGIDPAHLVDYKEMLQYNGYNYLVFEHLDMDLYKLLKQRDRPLTINEIRPIVHQLLTALNSLRRVGVVHSDIKPDNIMLVNHRDQPFRVKLIDFGVSFLSGDVELTKIFQPLGYCAPEVTLGLPITEAIDMWGLGCLFLYLYLGNDAFAPCEYQTIKAVVDMLGQPDDRLLSRGVHTRCFFKRNKHWSRPEWSLKTPGEYQSTTGIKPLLKTPQVRCLHDLITLYPVTHGSTELSDRMLFFNLMESIMEVDPAKRMTPERALSHPFFTMLHLMEGNGGNYLTDAVDKMKVLGLDDNTHIVSSDGVSEKEQGEDEALAILSSSDSAGQRSRDDVTHDVAATAEEESGVAQDEGVQDKVTESSASPAEKLDDSFQFDLDPAADTSWYFKVRRLVENIWGVVGRLARIVF